MTSPTQSEIIAPSGGLMYVPSAGAEWWRTAVVYQVYPRSFADSNGDGNGDLPGITSRLSYLRDLGVDAIWISPFYPSPQADGGYDVADYRDVDPMYGTLADADDLIATAHDLGLRVIIDIVPNHTSDEHPWFQAALVAGPGSPERDRYCFVDHHGLPNNWPSEFGGPAWTQVEDGQWYLHLFDRKQPDLNWENPEVREMFADTLRFWLDRGVDGFRIDVAHHLIKAPGYPDHKVDWDAYNRGVLPTNAMPFADQDRVHEIYREWRTILDSYPGDRAMVAEAWVTPHDRLAMYIREDEFQQAFNFDFMRATWDVDSLRTQILATLRNADSVGAVATWVISNHDVIRPATRLVRVDQTMAPWILEATEPEPDLELGLRRARAAATLMLALPGSSYVYQGEELGLREVIELPAEARTDPDFIRGGGHRLGRDGCRVPVPWEKGSAAFGFNNTGASWLPQPIDFGDYAVDQQLGRDDSTLELYRMLLSIRRQYELGSATFEFVDLGADLLAFDLINDHGRTRVMLNLGTVPRPIASEAQVLIASVEGVSDTLPPDSAAWLALS
ncbi:glycoside hydrolase family 13 protein [Lysinibacter sp. HNR]|uniref:glycoside hydrolase family 13 protein n=1 Tax=Lysinibacter sp. HNR TaxID=3031408 RepID=UPI0024355430|nr:glycoside hydrolase family 13 protein [Lysinibacter sp. HNR]WGD36910.1 glycoside hydrolase family 13 protein [Lysinibacter sp. HNR]